MADTVATQIDKQDDVVIVRVLSRNLDENNTRMVHSEINEAVETSGGVPFILDLEMVKFLPSLTLGAMVRLANEFRSRGQRLILSSLQPTVRQVITITRLDRVFEIQDDIESALGAIRV
jgi:anti-anti-sigma factor